MEKLLELLKDGHARTTLMLAMELNTTVEDIRRQLEYLEHIGAIRSVSFSQGGCAGCTGCVTSAHPGSAAACKGCLPQEGFQNMGELWEVVI